MAPRDKEGGDFKLVTSKSPRGKKDPAPIVTTSSLETGGDKSTAAPVSKKKKQEELKAAASKNASSSAKTKKGEKGEIPVVTTIREKGEIPVVRAIAKPEDETPQIPEIDVSHPVTTTETTYKLVTSDTTPFVSKGDVGGVGKKTRRKGGRKRGQWDNEEGATSEKVVSSGSGEEGERKEGEFGGPVVGRVCVFILNLKHLCSARFLGNKTTYFCFVNIKTTSAWLSLLRASSHRLSRH